MKITSHSLLALPLLSLVFFASTPFAAHASDAPLAVTDVQQVQSSPVSDGTYANGWKWVFNVTVPSDETRINVKVSDLVSGNNVIPVTGTTRFYSPQALIANSEGTAENITASNSYDSGTQISLDPQADLDSVAVGRQIQVIVETAIPTGSVDGSYALQYGIDAEAPVVSSPVVSNSPALTIATANDTPAERVVLGDPSNPLPNVPVTAFTVHAANSDISVSNITFTANTTGVTDVGYLAPTFNLYEGAILLGTVTASTASGDTQTLSFSNVSIGVPANSGIELTISADTNPIDGGDVPEGSSVQVTVDGTALTATASGGSADHSGSATGNIQSLRTALLVPDDTPTTTAVATAYPQSTAQTGTFTFVFNVTAYDQDIYISSSTDTAFGLTVQDFSLGPVSVDAEAITSSADRTQTGDFVIHAGQTKQLTITAVKDSGNNNFEYASLDTLYYATSTAALVSTDTENSLSLPSNTYTTSPVRLSSGPTIPRSGPTGVN